MDLKHFEEDYELRYRKNMIELELRTVNRAIKEIHDAMDRDGVQRLDDSDSVFHLAARVYYLMALSKVLLRQHKSGVTEATPDP